MHMILLYCIAIYVIPQNFDSFTEYCTLISTYKQLGEHF